MRVSRRVKTCLEFSYCPPSLPPQVQCEGLKMCQNVSRVFILLSLPPSLHKYSVPGLETRQSDVSQAPRVCFFFSSYFYPEMCLRRVLVCFFLVLAQYIFFILILTLTYSTCIYIWHVFFFSDAYS